MNRIFTRLVAMPMCVKGLTCPQLENGDYVIFINENLCEETRQKVFEHELKHIRRDHFRDTIEVAVAEMEANGPTGMINTLI